MNIQTPAHLKKLFACKLCWQISLSLFTVILVIELLLLIPFYLSFRTEQLKLFEQKQIHITKVLLQFYTKPDSENYINSIIKNSNIAGLTIFTPDGTPLKSFGVKPSLSPVDFEKLKPLGAELYKRGTDQLYGFWDQQDLNAPYEVVASLKVSELKDIRYQFFKSYWNEALIILIFMVLASLIITYIFLIRPIRSAYSILAKSEKQSVDLAMKISHLPNNELGFIFKVTNRLFSKLARIIIELKDKSAIINDLNANLESTVATRTKQLHESNQALKTMALLPEENNSPIFRTNLSGEFLYTNPACKRLFGFWDCSETKKLPENWANLIPAIYASKTHKQVEVATENTIYLLDFVPIEGERYINIYGLDITEQKTTEQENKFLQNHNPTTHLYNKKTIKLLLEETIRKQKNLQMAVFFLQINDLMAINQSLGHHVGDMFLRHIATLLKQHISDKILLGHFSQNIFVIANHSKNITEDADLFSAKLMNLFTKPLIINEQSLRTSVNIGIALYPNDSSSINELFKFSDMALLQAASQGVNEFKFFTEELNKKLSGRHKTYQALYDAVQNKQLLLYYQPQLELMENKIVGVEALIRWQHPKMGLLPPDEFIDILEKSSLIFQLTEWLLESAIKQHLNLKKASFGSIRIAVNLSAQQLYQEDLLDILTALMDKYIFEARYIEIEITERTSLIEPEKTIAILEQIQHLGFEIALDDFGTEYSSLIYLQKLPINKLKIDKQFISLINEAKDNETIVRAIIQLAKELKLNTIAEGIETKAQKELLKQLGCNEIQGYYIAKPLSETELIAFLQTT